MPIVAVLVAALLGAPAPGADDVGVVDPATGVWSLGSGVESASFYFGDPGDIPFMGDWDCDGVDTPGLYRRSDGYVYLRNANTEGPAERSFFFGDPFDLPLAGDFDGDGCDTVSLYRPGEQRVYLIDRLGAADGGLGRAERSFVFGDPGDAPFVGDFDGDGVDEVGLHRDTTGFAYLRFSHTTGIADEAFFFGDPGDHFVAGDWDGDGVATPGVFRPPDELFHLRDANGPGAGDERRAVCAGDGTPVAGRFGIVTPPVAATRSVGLVPAPDEALPLDGKVIIRAVSAAESVELTGRGAAAVSVPTGAATLRLGYVGSDGAVTGTCWRQPVAAGAEEVVVVQPWRDDRPAAAGDIVLAWQSGDPSRHPSQLAAAPGLTVTSPVWWHVTAGGGLTSTASAALVERAHDLGLEVWPAIASLDPDRAHAAFADPDRRSALAAEVSEAARRLGVDGVNLDIEGYRVADARAVAAFAEEVTALVHAWGGTTSVDVTMRSEGWELTTVEGPHWSSAPLRRRLAAAVDYTILMAYDQHNRLRPAGPVAAPGWVEEGLRYLLRFADPDRVVLGVPFYARVWDPADLGAPRAVGLGTIADLVAAGARTPDPAFGVDRVDLPDGRFTWAEVPGALAHRVDLVDRYGLAGIAAWRLGFDPPQVWPIIAPR
jgi:hypothetical protein